MAGKRKQVEKIDRDQPKFIKEFKKAKGCSDEPKLEDKFIEKTDSDDERIDHRTKEELPVVVFDDAEFTKDQVSDLFKPVICNKKHKFRLPNKDSTEENKLVGKHPKSETSDRKPAKHLSFTFDDE